MRTLSSTLLAAQRSASRQPFVRVVVHDKIAGAARLAWTRLYEGSEPDSHHAVTMPQDGSLIRARVLPSTGDFYLQRVTNPGPGSNFGSWTLLTTASDSAGIALCSEGSRVLLFYVATDGRSLYVRESTDDGASYGSPYNFITMPSTVQWLAADVKPNGDAAVFFFVPGDTLYVIKRTGGTWGNATGWSHSVSSVRGIACVHQGDWNLALCGQDAAGSYKTWLCIYGDGVAQASGTWSSLRELTKADSGSGIEFRCPSLSYPDLYRLFFVEKLTGSSAYQRPVWSHTTPGSSFDQNLWREPQPLDLSSTYGLSLAYGTSYAWLSAPYGVWRAPLPPASVEVTTEVLRLMLRESASGGQLRLELRNDDGRFNLLGSGAYGAVKEGSQVEVSPGYVTAAGAEVSQGPTCWIQGWEHRSSEGKASLLIFAHDGWGLLEAWTARRQFKWNAGEKSVLQLLTFILSRSGVALVAISTSSDVTGLMPAFTIHPGEDGAQAVRRLLSTVPDVLFFRGPTAYLTYPQAGDATNYSYGTIHSIFSGSYVQRIQRANRVQAYGSGVTEEAFDWSSLSVVEERLLQVHDLNLDSLARAQSRAQAELRKAQRGGYQGAILVPANCGQEIYDVLDVTDSRASLSAAKWRVQDIDLEYDRSNRVPVYHQKITLAGV